MRSGGSAAAGRVRMGIHTHGSLFIEHVGTAVPEVALDRPRSVELFSRVCRDARSAKLVSRIARLSGVERRYLAALDPRYAPDGEEALYRPLDEQPNGPGMGARLALFERVAPGLVLRALAGLPREAVAAVDALVTVSCTHASSPGLERPILTQTPVRPNVDRWNLGFMGCSAGLAALRMLQRMASGGWAAPRALIVACELSSLHFQYSDRLDQITANLLFADGAAALTVGPAPAAARVLDCRCVAVPEQARQMVWVGDDHGLRLELSQELPDTLGANIRAVASDFLAPSGAAVDDVDHWVIHPGGPQILDSVAAGLGLGETALEASRGVLRDFGNMSSPTVFFILKRLLDAGARGRCVMMAFGPGLTIELALLELDPARP